MESLRSFVRRAENATGLEFGAIPWGKVAEVLGGQILVRHGDLAVVTHGYPDREDSDGVPVWDPKPENFRLVALTDSCYWMVRLDYLRPPLWAKWPPSRL